MMKFTLENYYATKKLESASVEYYETNLLFKEFVILSAFECQIIGTIGGKILASW